MSLSWHDKKDVYIINTKHSKAEMVEKGKIRRKKGSTEEAVLNPICVVDYNCGIGGVFPSHANMCKRI